VPTRARKAWRVFFCSRSWNLQSTCWFCRRSCCVKRNESVELSPLASPLAAGTIGHRAIHTGSELVNPQSGGRLVPNDEENDPVLETALHGRVHVLCTLDRHFHHRAVLESCRKRGIEVLRMLNCLSACVRHPAPDLTVSEYRREFSFYDPDGTHHMRMWRNWRRCNDSGSCASSHLDQQLRSTAELNSRWAYGWVIG
jgi:hypothetical protein